MPASTPREPGISPRIASSKHAPSLTLVPNRRAFERQLAQAFVQQTQVQVMVAPALEVLSNWVERTASQIMLLRGQAVPGSADELLLDQYWQQAVLADEGWVSAFEAATLARTARSAERQLRQWSGPQPPAWLEPRFQRWRQQVRGRMSAAKLYSAEDWTDCLIRQLGETAREAGGTTATEPNLAGSLPLRLPEHIMLHGFVELTRQEQSLFAALERHGVAINSSSGVHGIKPPASDDRPPGQHRLHAFDSPADELQAVAHWARRQLDQAGNDPRRIAVVAHGLQGQADELMAVFDRVLHPRDALGVALDGDSLYHLPDSSRLSDHAVFDDALLLLRMQQQGMRRRHPFPQISQLLLSTHVAGADTEAAARAGFELRLRAEGVHAWSLQDLWRALARWKLEDSLPVLNSLLARLDAAMPRSGPSQDTADALWHALQEWGWPGPLLHGQLASTRVHRLVGLIERLRPLEVTSERQALAILTQWCRDTRVTERGGPLSPVQILSAEGVVDDHYDAAWVMNLHDGNWPGNPVSQALLPHAVAQNIPRATPQGELDFCRRVQHHLVRLASEVHFSWSHSGGEVPRQPSPLLRLGLDEQGQNQQPGDAQQPLPPDQAAAARAPWPGLHTGVMTGYARHPYLQAIDDLAGLPLASDGETAVPGGSGMFRDQSACPMMAYLLHRLQLRFEPMPGPFADYAFRGKLLHDALYKLFEAQAGQPGLPPASRIAGAVADALRQRQADRLLSAPSLQAEQLRLQRLLRQWLAFESQRSGFTVEALEQAREMDLRGYRIRIRMDRIDRLDDGRMLIIDYKSGGVDAKPWGQERIGEAQLPLYAVLLDAVESGSVGGLALASVRSGACTVSGVVDAADAAWDKLYSSGNRRAAMMRQYGDWDSLLQHWRSGVDALLEEIIHGQAANRQYRPEALTYAGLDTVLRCTEGQAWLLEHAAGSHAGQGAARPPEQSA